MMARMEMASKPLPDSKTQEEKENEEMSLFNFLTPVGAELAAKKKLTTSPLPCYIPLKRAH